MRWRASRSGQTSSTFTPLTVSAAMAYSSSSVWQLLPWTTSPWSRYLRRECQESHRKNDFIQGSKVMLTKNQKTFMFNWMHFILSVCCYEWKKTHMDSIPLFCLSPVTLMYLSYINVFCSLFICNKKKPFGVTGPLFYFFHILSYSLYLLIGFQYVQFVLVSALLMCLFDLNDVFYVLLKCAKSPQDYIEGVFIVFVAFLSWFDCWLTSPWICRRREAPQQLHLRSKWNQSPPPPPVETSPWEIYRRHLGSLKHNALVWNSL